MLTSGRQGVVDLDDGTLWKVDEVARYLRLTPETVRKMARDSKIPSIKMGRTYRFRKTDIQSWLEFNLKNYSLEK